MRTSTPPEDKRDPAMPSRGTRDEVYGRPRQSQMESAEPPAYPSLADVSRRGFLGWAAAGAAAAAAGGVAEAQARARGRPAGRARRPPPREVKVTVRLPWGLRVGKAGSVRAERVVVWTRNQRLARFLRDSKNLSRVQAAAARHVRRAEQDTPFDGRKIYRLERAVARAIARVYRRQTRRSAGRMDLMIQLARRYPIRTAGVMVRPVQPFRP